MTIRKLKKKIKNGNKFKITKFRVRGTSSHHSNGFWKEKFKDNK